MHLTVIVQFLILDDGIFDVEINTTSMTMGATGNPNITRLASLQERKKHIEDSLAKCNQELKEICLQVLVIFICFLSVNDVRQI